VNVRGNVEAHPEWSGGTTEQDLGPLLTFLAQRNIQAVFAPDWLAFPITFRTNGRILAAEPGCFRRIPGNYDRIRQLPLVAWIDVDGGEELARILEEEHANFVRTDVGRFVVFDSVFPVDALPFCGATRAEPDAG
jgi:hypothetical protein